MTCQEFQSYPPSCLASSPSQDKHAKQFLSADSIPTSWPNFFLQACLSFIFVSVSYICLCILYLSFSLFLFSSCFMLILILIFVIAIYLLLSPACQHSDPCFCKRFKLSATINAILILLSYRLVFASHQINKQ